jgi:hypothetical protein
MKARSIFVVFALLIYIILTPAAHAADVLLNEFVANPQSGDVEWVEFYNTTSSTIDLSDYYFDDDSNFDSDSGNSAKIALAGLLSSSQTCFWELSSYLNNNGDIPSLFKTGSIVDSYSYSSSSAGLSYARVPDGGNWSFLQTPTKATSKCIDLAPTNTLTPTSSPTPIPTSTNTPTVTNKPTQTPTITKTISKSPSPTNETSPTKEAEVLGQATENKNLSKEETKVLGENNINFIPLIFISIGIVFLILCVILVCYPYIKNYLNSKNE